MTGVGRQLHLPMPRFYCPIEPREQQGAEELGAAALEWTQRIGLETDPGQLERLVQADFGGLTAKTMPDALRGPSEVMACLHAALFTLDDRLCDESGATPGELGPITAQIRRVLEIPNALGPDDSVYAKALDRIRVGFEPFMTDGQLNRWIGGMRKYLSALVPEAAFRRGTVLPGASDYLITWMHAIGMAPSTALLDVVAGYELPEQDLDRPQVRALTEMTWVLVALDNDLYSRHKEVDRVGDTLNIVDVLARERECSLMAAQDEAVRLRDSIMERFLELGEAVKAHADAPLARYVRALGQFVRGHLDWALSSVRYAEDQDRLRSADTWWKSAPAASSPEQFGLPSIAWWWSV